MNQPDGFIDPHGGFRNLKSYQMTEIVHHRLSDCRDCRRYKELKLVGIARASLEELLLDYQDFLRQRNLPLWGKNHPKAQKIRQLAYASEDL